MNTKEERRTSLTDLNEHIVCPLCRGYLIDATTLVECLHSFCRGCIVRRLSSGARVCPVCNAATLPPLLPDIKLQRLVYLIVPGLFRSELERRRHFRLVNPQCSVLVTPVGAPELTFDDLVSLSLCEIDQQNSHNDPKDEEPKIQSDYSFLNDKNEDVGANTLLEQITESEEKKEKVRYLKCPAGVTVRHLLRLLMLKRGWNDSDNTMSITNKIELLCESEKDDKSVQVLNPSWTLLDLACIFEWKRETPMKLLYRIVKRDENDPNLKSQSYSAALHSENALHVIEDIQRPPTPPPSPKPISHMNMPSQLKEIKSQKSNNVDHIKELETKKPRCEVTPVLRTPDPLENHEQSSMKSSKIVKLEHHKRRKRRNKRVIAEITTTPREDMLKLKVRLTPCPPRVTSNQTKEKLLQMRAVRRDKIKSKSTYPQSKSGRDGHSDRKEDSEEETIEQIIDSIPDEVMEIAEIANPTSDHASNEKSDDIPKTAQKMELPTEETPKDEEVLRQLGLINNHEMDREKLEKQLKESKANRVRSLLAEKQMRETLESIKSMTNTKNKDVSPVGNNAKKKGPPPLAPLRSAKSSTSTFKSLVPFISKCEIPLDLSNAGSKSSVLHLSSSPNAVKNLASNHSQFPHTSSSIKSNTTDQPITCVEKPQEERKPQDANLHTLSNAAVSLLGETSVVEKPLTSRDLVSKVSNKVALRIPQPHQRISGFGMKMKPNLGIRHIPNPQAIVASQFRNQGTAYFTSSHRPP